MLVTNIVTLFMYLWALTELSFFKDEKFPPLKYIYKNKHK